MWLIFVMFLLTGCTSSSPWTYREMKCDTPSALLLYPAENTYSGIELKFLAGNFGTVGYLNIYQGCVTRAEKDPQKAEVLYTIEGKRRKTFAFVMEGEQSLLLSEKATLTLLTALSEGKECEITLKGYSSKIVASNFPTLYKKFLLIDNFQGVDRLQGHLGEAQHGR